MNKDNSHDFYIISSTNDKLTYKDIFDWVNSTIPSGAWIELGYNEIMINGSFLREMMEFIKEGQVELG